MQFVRTDVAPATAPTGESVLRVTFCGEGGDCVTVDMAGVDLGNEEAVERARAILVQTATFGMAVNEYDANSNGNFAEVDVIAANDANGAVYIFEYRDGEGSRQVPPSRMPNLEVAREDAIRSAIALLDDLPRRAGDLSDWLVRVRNENGELLCTIDVEEAETARKKSQ